MKNITCSKESRVNWILIVLSVIICLLIIIPLVQSFINYDRLSLQSNVQKWSLFQDYMKGISAPLVALIGIMATITVNIYSQRNIRRQEMLQRPLVFVRCFDYENEIRMVLQNKGIGPLIIKKYSINDTRNLNISYTGILECLDGIGLKSDNYTGNQDGLVLAAGDKRELFLLTDSNKSFDELKNQVRERLKDMQIEIKYNDIYDQEMPVYKKSLEWYGHRLDKAK